MTTEAGLTLPVEAPPTHPRKPWQAGLAPQFITLFLWVAFYDRLAPSTLAVGGLAWSSLGALAGALGGYLLFYLVPATWGLGSRRGLIGVAAATFGRSGARWLPGGLLGLAQVGWFAAGNYYATTYMLEGLAACRLTGPPELTRDWHGWTVAGPLVLTTALVWTFAFAATSRYLLRVIAAIMIVYPIVPAAALGFAMTRNLTGLGVFDVRAFADDALQPAGDAGRQAFWAMAQWVGAFLAASGLLAADWGASSRDTRDVRVGGLVGVVLAPTIVVILALATIAGTCGRRPPTALVAARADFQRAQVMRGQGPVVDQARRDLEAAQAAAPARLTFDWALKEGIGGPLGGGLLIAFALASMAPAVYAAFLGGSRFAALASPPSQTLWTFLTAAAAYPLVILGVPGRPELFLTVMGAALAPVAGAMAADALLHRGRWPGERPGVNLAGFLAWGVGLVVGLLPVVGPLLGRPELGRVIPSTFLAGLAALTAYLLFAAIGLETRAVPATSSASDPDEAAVTSFGM